MKKLLSLIGAFTLTASATSVLISCSNKDDDDKYGNIFINDDGDFKITTEDLLNWYNDTYGRLGKDPQKFLVEFYNIFAVAVYENASTENSVFKGKTTKSNGYINEYLNDEGIEDGNQFAKSLETQYGKKSKAANTIYGRANNEMENARKEYLDNKKQGTKAWVKYLKGQFPWVNGDQTALENAWISNYILTDSTNSAYANLSKTLGFGATDSTWSNGYNTIKVNDTEISALLATFLSVNADVNIDNTSLNEPVIKQATSESQKTSIINLINVLGGKNAFNSTTDTTDGFKIDFIENINDTFFTNLTWNTFLSGISLSFANNKMLGKISEMKDIFTISNVTAIKLDQKNEYKDFYNYEGISSRNLNKTQIVSVAPILNSKKDNQKINILSNSQRYLIDNYFEAKKPVATSEIVLDFSKINSSSTPDINKEISPAQFVNTSSTVDELIKYFEGFYNFYTAYISNSVGGSNNKQSATSIYSNAETSSTTGLTDFETFYRGANKGNLWKLGQNQTDTGIGSFLTAKNNEKLLTLDYDTTAGTYSNLAKYSVYDFLTSENTQYEPQIKTDWDSSTTNIDNWDTFKGKMEKMKDNANAVAGMNLLFTLVNDLGRHLPESTTVKGNTSAEAPKPYKVLNDKDGIIAFIDTDGLHFMKIDGYSLFNSETKTENKDKEQSMAYDLLSKTNKELVPYLLNPKIKSDKSTTQNSIVKVDNGAESATTPTPGTNADISKQEIIEGMGTSFGNDYSKIINYSITNDYERFLVNNTVAKGMLSSDNDKNNLFYNFDILADAKSTISTSENFGLLSQWLWIYLGEILGKDGEELFGSFFATDGENVDKKAVAELLSVIETQQNKISEFTMNFNDQNDKWIESVKDNYNKQYHDLETKVSRKFIPNYAIEVPLENIDSSKIWITEISKGKTNSIFIYKVSDYFYNDEIIINSLNKHKGGVK
ncbi:hypothetical protein CG007_01365 [Mesoplasma entomophilum]|uniref:lipoprotein n=1 Tax=Mesoplasma entomophilum TaxID=2149 RepID=UPI000D03CCD9|nr:lipoprotein [Mesoplasma entomophilum]AVN60266.1 hypothetical protein CG007_01365 [Mesoplasma entomophilum]